VNVGCQRTVHVKEQMTWECAADEYNSRFYPRPDEYVRFRYVENPRCFDVETSKNFCAELRRAGKTVVNVDFELWGHSHTLRGYRIVSVDGRPIQDVGGWGHNGANDYSGFCPPHRAFAR
jgi:hypothetical protein